MPSPLSPSHLETRRRARGSARLVLGGIALNLALAALKLAGGVFGHTYALIADGVESLLDVFSSALVWAGFRVAARPPDDNHPYGHGKAEPLAALAVALFIFAAAAWVGTHAVREILAPHRAPHWATLPLLAGIVAVKWWFSRRMRRAGESEGSTALGAEAWHHYADAVTSAAAFIGIALVVLGGERFLGADAWAALFACGVIAFNGVHIFNRALADVMDTAVPAAFENEVRAVALGVKGVLGVEKCRVRKSGLIHLADIHVVVNPEISVYEGHEIAHAVKDALEHSALHIADVSVHIEPARPSV